MQFENTDHPGVAELRNDHGRRVIAYHYDHFDFHPYCHPVNLPDGTCLSIERPADHPWHNGMAFAWKYLNGCNVWDFEASGPKRGYVEHRNIELGKDAPVLEHHLVWQDENRRDLLEDRRRLAVEFDAQGLPAFDWTFAFYAPHEDVLCERHVGWGGYGGFYMRFARGTGITLLNAEGRKDMEEEERLSSRWCAYAYALDGRPSWTNFEHYAGLAIFDHPANPRHPTPWLTYNRINMQKIMPAFIRDEPYFFARGDRLTLRYRAQPFYGKPDFEELEAAWREWAGRP